MTKTALGSGTVAAPPNQETEHAQETTREFEKTNIKEPYNHKTSLNFPNLPGTTNAPGSWEVSVDPWLREKSHWTDTIAGKVAIEFISRITLGGIFYSLMENSQAMAKMRGYSQTKFNTDKEALKKASLLEKSAYFIDKNLSQPSVKFLDKYIYNERVAKDPVHKEKPKQDTKGKKISKAKMALRFRENRHLFPGQTLEGRSLGAEMTIVTASFAAMSAGSAIMRNILTGLLNPRERQAWANNGKFDPVHIGKRFGQKLWEIGTYNAGEDVAAALPYVFFMRWQRNFIDKYIAKGFRHSSDNVDNGGGLRLGEDGKIVGHMVYGGLVDLQGRFTVYNVFTQFYRDLYNNVGANLKQWWNSGREIRAPEWLKNPATAPGAMLKGTKNLLRYLTVSTIRSVIQMTPSVPFFSILRVSASKTNGMVVHSEHGGMHFASVDELRQGNIRRIEEVKTNLGGYYLDGKFHYTKAAYQTSRDADGKTIPNNDYVTIYSKEVYHNNKAVFDQLDEETRNAVNMPKKESGVIGIFDYGKKGKDDKWVRDTENRYDPFGYGRNNQNLNGSSIVRNTDDIGRALHRIAENKYWAGLSTPIFKFAKKHLNYEASSLEGAVEGKETEEFQNRRLAKDAWLAGIPYAAYFSAKVAAREAYVNEQMNMAIERMVDGFLSLNRSEISAGIAEISNAVWRQPLSNPERQAELLKRHLANPADNSPNPEGWTSERHKDLRVDIASGKPFDQEAKVLELNEVRYDRYVERVEERRKRRGIAAEAGSQAAQTSTEKDEALIKKMPLDHATREAEEAKAERA